MGLDEHLCTSMLLMQLNEGLHIFVASYAKCFYLLFMGTLLVIHHDIKISLGTTSSVRAIDWLCFTSPVDIRYIAWYT